MRYGALFLHENPKYEMGLKWPETGTDGSKTLIKSLVGKISQSDKMWSNIPYFLLKCVDKPYYNTLI